MFNTVGALAGAWLWRWERIEFPSGQGVICVIVQALVLACCVIDGDSLPSRAARPN